MIFDRDLKNLLGRRGTIGDQPSQPSHVKIVPPGERPFDWEKDVPELVSEENTPDPSAESSVDTPPNVISMLGRLATKTPDSFPNINNIKKEDGSIDPSIVNRSRELPPDLKPPNDYEQ